MRLPKAIRVSDGEAKFVQAILSGSKPNDAAALAGYGNPADAASRLLRAPAVLNALNVELGRLVSGRLVPAALLALEKILEGGREVYGERVFADVALKVAAMGGFVPPRQAVTNDTADKDPEQMTDTELREACDVLEAELAGRAKDITPDSETTDADLADLL